MKHITVGYDGSAPAAEAVSWAAYEAASRGARLRIVSCYEIPAAGGAVYGYMPAEAIASLLEAAETSLSAVRSGLAQIHPHLEIVTEASPGPVVPVLMEDLAPDDLLVVGASAHHGAGAVLLGSTPRRVVRHSPCPVVVVRGAASRGRPDRVVVGVDGSPTSDEALRWACDEADRHGVPLSIVHCWWYPYVDVAEESGATRARELTEIDAACVLDEAAEAARERVGIDVDASLAEGSPVAALLSAIRDGDLLVLGSRGRGAFAEHLFGSTVNAVLEECPVPVVVVRGEEVAA